MKFTTLLSLAVVAAMAVPTTLPAAAAEDDAPAHVSRDWKGGGGTLSRGSVPNQRGSTRTSTVTRDTSNHEAPKVTYAQPKRDSDDDNDGYGRRRRHGHDRHGHDGLDPAEAARIRNAHREAGRHVTLRRDYDIYGAPSYRTPGYRRQHWWSFWW